MSFSEHQYTGIAARATAYYEQAGRKGSMLVYIRRAINEANSSLNQEQFAQAFKKVASILGSRKKERKGGGISKRIPRQPGTGRYNNTQKLGDVIDSVADRGHLLLSMPEVKMTQLELF